MRRFASFFALVLLAAPVALPALPAAADDPPTCFDLPATIFGTSGSIVGTNGNDVIVGSPGNDTIKAGRGDDLVCGGAGDDRIDGGDGIDFLAGEDGVDQLAGGSGKDLLGGDGGFGFSCFDSAADRLDGQSGDDFILDQCGANRATGGTGHDTGVVTGTFDAGADSDNISVVLLPSTQFPGSVITLSVTPPVTALESCPGCGDARATGGTDEDFVGVAGGVADGGSGDDMVTGSRPGDVALGGLGADRVEDWSETGGLRLDGGPGRDTCDLNGQTTDTVSLCEVVVP